MSQVIDNAIKYVEESKVGLLLTVDENKVPFVRSIGAFSTEGANIYFLTAKATEKVKHIKENPIVTFHFQNEGQPIQTFKSVAITGEASEITDSEEFAKAVEAISVRYPLIKERVASGEIENSSIYSVKAKFIKSADYTQSPREVIVNL